MDFSESSQSSERCRLEHMSVMDRKHGLHGSESSHFGYEENRVLKVFLYMHKNRKENIQY